MVAAKKNFEAADKSNISELRAVLLAKNQKIENTPFMRISASLLKLREALEEEKNILGTLLDGEGHNIRADVDYNDVKCHDQITNISSGCSAKTGNTAGYGSLMLKPGEVGKSITPEIRYEGKPSENLRKKYELFLSICRLNGVTMEQQEIILEVMYVFWLNGAARTYFGEHLKHVTTVEEAICALENHFLSLRVRRINEEKWNSLSFSLMRKISNLMKRTADRASTYESALNSLFQRIDEFGGLKSRQREIGKCHFKQDYRCSKE